MIPGMNHQVEMGWSVLSFFFGCQSCPRTSQLLTCVMIVMSKTRVEILFVSLFTISMAWFDLPANAINHERGIHPAINNYHVGMVYTTHPYFGDGGIGLSLWCTLSTLRAVAVWSETYWKRTVNHWRVAGWQSISWKIHLWLGTHLPLVICSLAVANILFLLPKHVLFEDYVSWVNR